MPPSKIVLSKDRRFLSVEWEGAAPEVHRLSAVSLRANCQSSRAKRARLDGGDGRIADDLTITDVRPVGLYAVNLVFSDGHDRGIYPWAYLRELAGRAVENQGEATRGN